MPNTKAAKKSLRQDKKLTVKNSSEKNKIKSLIKKALKASTAGQTDQVKALAVQLQKAVDKAVKHGWLKKNAGDRKKSRLASSLKRVSKK